MAEKPFLTLGPKQWLSGIAPSAHTGTGGIFFKADGITPLYDAGGTASTENGLLQAGATPTSWTLSDIPFASTATSYAGAAALYILGAAGHLYSKAVGAASPTDLRSGTPISNPANGITVWGPAGVAPKLYYWMQAYIGTWDLSGSYPTGWNDTAYAITQGANSATLKPVHQFVGNVYYGNGDRIGSLVDDGAMGITHASNALDFPTRKLATSITDDSRYLVIATTENVVGESLFARNTFYFWDTFSTSWQAEWDVYDPYIWKVLKIGRAIYAFGQYGIYQVTFDGGVKKILSRFIGMGTAADLQIGYGANRATIYNNDALLMGTDTTLDTFGKLSPDVPTAHLKPFKIPSGGGRPTMLSSSLDAGRVYVGTSASKLYGFDFNGATHDTGNTAQTVYIPLEEAVCIDRIDLIFAEPLASGDAFGASIYTDEDTTPVDYGSATYTDDGALRRKSLTSASITATAENQLSLLLTYTTGAVKLKYVEFYGTPLEPNVR
jgi:hypothetical protein